MEILLIPFVPENIIIIVVVVVVVVVPIVITGSSVRRGAPSVCDNNDDDVIIYEILLFVFLRYLLYKRIYLSNIYTYRYPRRSLSLSLAYPVLPSPSSVRLTTSHRRLLLYRYIMYTYSYSDTGLVSCSRFFSVVLSAPRSITSLYVCVCVYTQCRIVYYYIYLLPPLPLF